VTFPAFFVAAGAARGKDRAMWPFAKRTRFEFRPEWKERMIVTGSGGSFVLYFPMGVPTIALPSEERWASVAPPWAVGQWQDLHDELAAWCRDNKVLLEVDPRAGVY
jgi:hypothetical protein